MWSTCVQSSKTRSSVHVKRRAGGKPQRKSTHVRVACSCRSYMASLCQPPRQRIHTQETARIATRRRSRLLPFPKRWSDISLCQLIEMSGSRSGPPLPHFNKSAMLDFNFILTNVPAPMLDNVTWISRLLPSSSSRTWPNLAVKTQRLCQGWDLVPHEHVVQIRSSPPQVSSMNPTASAKSNEVGRQYILCV